MEEPTNSGLPENSLNEHKSVNKSPGISKCKVLNMASMLHPFQFSSLCLSTVLQCQLCVVQLFYKQWPVHTLQGGRFADSQVKLEESRKLYSKTGWRKRKNAGPKPVAEENRALGAPASGCQRPVGSGWQYYSIPRVQALHWVN